jgi:acyl transferase domain-containing protein
MLIGVMGLIRTALILHHGMVPKALHFETPNPNIPWDRLPLEVPTKNTPLSPSDADGKYRIWQ